MSNTIKELGKGGFGVVIRRRRNANVEVVKWFKRPNDRDTEWHIYDRIRNMGGHHRILKAIEQTDIPNPDPTTNTINPTVNGIVFPYYSLGSLTDYIENKQPMVTEQVICKWIGNVAEGLKHLAALFIVHFDLKPQNLLVKAMDQSLVIGDLGLALHYHQLPNNLNGHARGTYQYSAPEVLRGGEFDCKSDIFSLGIIAWELATTRLPTYNVEADWWKNWNQLARSIYRRQQSNTWPPSLPHQYSAQFKDLVYSMMAVDRLARVNASDVFDHHLVQQSRQNPPVIDVPLPVPHWKILHRDLVITKHSLTATRQSKTDAEARVTDVETMLKSVQDILTQTNADLAEAENQKATITSQLQPMHDQLTTHQTKITSLEQQISQYRRTIGSMTVQSTRHNRELLNQERLFENSKIQIDQLQQRLDTAAKQTETVKTTQHDFDIAIEQLTAERNTAQDKLREVTTELESCKAARKVAEEHASNEEQKVILYSQSLDLARTERASQDTVIQSLHQQLAELNQQIITSQQHLQDSELLVHDGQSERVRLDQSLEQVQEENAALRLRVTELEQQNHNHDTLGERFLQQLQDFRTEMHTDITTLNNRKQKRTAFSASSRSSSQTLESVGPSFQNVLIYI